MPLETFSPQQEPNAGFDAETAPNVLQAAFGDGYVQRTPFGVNPLRRSWRLDWSPCWKDTALYIIGFARAHGAATPFWWTPPRELSPVRVVCPTWRDSPSSWVHDVVSLSFTEDFGLDV